MTTRSGLQNAKTLNKTEKDVAQVNIKAPQESKTMVQHNKRRFQKLIPLV